MSKIYYFEMSSPIGNLFLITDQTYLLALDFTPPQSGTYLLANADWPLIQSATKELQEYFAGKRTQFTIPLNPNGTVFQKAVWQLAQQIPYGQTISYSTLAQKLNRPQAYRAAAQALKRNPLPIFIPCHRIINKNGNLGGYFGGLHIKKKLLALENSSSAD